MAATTTTTTATAAGLVVRLNHCLSSLVLLQRVDPSSAGGISRMGDVGSNRPRRRIKALRGRWDKDSSLSR